MHLSAAEKATLTAQAIATGVNALACMAKVEDLRFVRLRPGIDRELGGLIDALLLRVPEPNEPKLEAVRERLTAVVSACTNSEVPDERLSTMASSCLRATLDALGMLRASKS